MSQPAKTHLIQTLAATQFRATLAQHAIATLDLATQLGPSAEMLVHAIQIQSVQNLAWGVYLYRRNTFHQTTIDANYLAGYKEFVAADGLQIAAANQFQYFSQNLAIPYWDENGLGQLHLGLVNRSAAGKSADDAGAISIRLFVSLPIGGN